MTAFSFDRSVRAPAHVLARELDGESILLNLDTEIYFGLDEVGTRVWNVVTNAPSVQAAYDSLLGEYDVSPDVLRRDMEALLSQLLERGLLELTDD